MLTSKKPPAHELAEQAAAIRSKINLIELITPTNVESEKQKWLDSGKEFFNPVFTYDDQKIVETIEETRKLVDLVKQASWESSSEKIDRIFFDALRRRCHEIEEMAEFLRILRGDFYFQNIGGYCLSELYGDLNYPILTLARSMIDSSSEEAIRNMPSFVGTADKFELKKREWFIKEYLNDFNGMFSREEKERLKNTEFDAQGIATIFKIAIDYLQENASFWGDLRKDQIVNPVYSIEIDPKWTAISVNAFSENGHPVIGIPPSRKVNGQKLIELVGHELNSHYRSAISARTMFGLMLGDKHPLRPLIPFATHSVNHSMGEGLAKISDVRVSGADSIPKPYQVLAINFAQNKHNFKETMEYVYDLTRKNRKSEKTARDNAWNVTYRIFRGLKNTSERSGYAFTKDQVYLTGFVGTIHEYETSYYNYYEDFLSLLRLSTLTLTELREIDRTEDGLDYRIGLDPFEIWSHEKRVKNKPDVVEYIANAILNR
ncbi:DUF1704 domain-containing protein [Candidatus Saccharibacteria bacterium]|nr:DUF1704 domain-containing protein [Candidatus Saccharibacteria bacterium]MBR6122603.1 DUF1704 domain-containing protein [Candidatus Saccharibacteria bacterium]